MIIVPLRFWLLWIFFFSPPLFHKGSADTLRASIVVSTFFVVFSLPLPRGESPSTLGCRFFLEKFSPKKFAFYSVSCDVGSPQSFYSLGKGQRSLSSPYLYSRNHSPSLIFPVLAASSEPLKLLNSRGFYEQTLSLCFGGVFSK